MDTSPPVELAKAHRHFSAFCFNCAWDLIETPNRSPEEDQQMLLLSLTSLWHWTQREDCTHRNLSIGHWQVSRVYALLGQPQNAARHGQRCLQYSEGQPPFYRAYAHEALARAAMAAADQERMRFHLGAARELARAVADAEERALLEKDLATLLPAAWERREA